MSIEMTLLCEGLKEEKYVLNPISKFFVHYIFEHGKQKCVDTMLKTASLTSSSVLSHTNI